MDPSNPSFTRAWTPIGETSNQLIVYHPPSHAIQVVPHPHRSSPDVTPLARFRSLHSEPSPEPQEPASSNCPLCGGVWSPIPAALGEDDHDPGDERGQTQYFRVLERAHEFSRPGTPVSASRWRHSRPESPSSMAGSDDEDDTIDASDLPAMGYYHRFFKEERRLGIGAEGSVYLATHVISGNSLGTYAVKKIAVGTSKSYLQRMLQEVRLLESLRHPNIIPYYHSWVDETRFSSFGPPILALHVLMMYASAGNLDAFLLSRSHEGTSQSPLTERDVADTDDIDLLPKAERIKAFKRRRQSGLGASRKEYRAVLLLGLEEIVKLFSDVVGGLAFLHSNSILHLDLKCSNVLLHWEDGQVIPKAMLSDFGTSEEMLRGRRERTGHTGTMEYMAPESIVTDNDGCWRPSDSHADMWSLGMILHKMMFLHLPYSSTDDDLAALHDEIIKYPGFTATSEVIRTCERRHIPRSLPLLLEKLLHLDPDQRPSAERVDSTLRSVSEQGPGNIFDRLWKGRAGSPINSRSSGMPSKGRRPRTTSTIRPILALPSSVITAVESTPTVVVHSRWDTWFSRKQLYWALFVVRVLSLQPGLVVSTPLPPFIVLVLTLLAIVDVRVAWKWSGVSIGLCAIHVATMVYYGRIRE